MSDLSRESLEIRKRQIGNMVRTRLVFISMCFAFAFAAVSLRAVEVTLFSDAWKKRGNYKTHNLNGRAEIVDRNGIILATNLKTQSAYANPNEMLEIKDAARKLARILPNTNYDTLLKEFSREGSRFVWLKRNLTPEEIKRINDLGIPGVYFTDDIARVYPHGPLFSHTLGYVNVDNQGLAGVEREFNDVLDMGGDTALQLSLDVRLQHILHDEIEKQFHDYSAEGAAGILMDVTNGEILAMVSLPDFDPNSPGTASKEQKFNRLTLGAYEMGSTFKPFTAAAALDAGAVHMNSTFDATTPIRVGHQTISDYHAKKRVLTLTEVMMYSSNIGTAKMALALGGEHFHQFLRKLGMFDYTDIEIPEKTKPLTPKRWPDITTMTVSFGHGISITPVHLAKAYGAVINGGKLLPLSILKHDPNSKLKYKQVIKPETSEKVRKIMRAIVISGTGRGAEVKGYVVGGKTGTAEKIVNGRYSGDKVMSSFAGAFPMNKPKYLVVVIVDDPKEKVRYVRPTGGVVAAPAVKNIVSRTGTMLGIKPNFDTEFDKTVYNSEEDDSVDQSHQD